MLRLINDFTYNKAKKSDAQRLSILLQTVYIQAYAEEGITFEFSNFIANRFSPAYIEKNIDEDPSRFIVAYFKNNPVGIAEIIYSGLCPIRKCEMPELSKLYVLDRFKGKGIGYELNKLVEEQLRSKGYNELFLEVWLKNPEGIAFYERQGYNSLGEVDFPMAVNTYVNVVMSKKLLN